MKQQHFMLFDGRAWGDSTGDYDYPVLDMANSEQECRELTEEGLHGEGNLWVEYDLINGVYQNARPREDLSTRTRKRGQ